MRQALCCLGLRERSYITKKPTGQTTGAAEVRDMSSPPRAAEPGGLVPTPHSASETHTTSSQYLPLTASESLVALSSRGHLLLSFLLLEHSSEVLNKNQSKKFHQMERGTTLIYSIHQEKPDSWADRGIKSLPHPPELTFLLLMATVHLLWQLASHLRFKLFSNPDIHPWLRVLLTLTLPQGWMPPKVENSVTCLGGQSLLSFMAQILKGAGYLKPPVLGKMVAMI